MATEDQQVTSMLEGAYALMLAFQETISHALDGDHPDAEEVEQWLKHYEQMRREANDA